MPRDGSGQYSYPPGTPGIPDTTIESAKYNGYIADVQQDLNLPRPIVAGGTGANNATQARTNLSTEVRGVQVTNYDSQVWEAGSFWSAPGATGGPLGTAGYFSGFCHRMDDQNIYLETRQYGSGGADLPCFSKMKSNNVWGTWKTEDFLQTAGDTMNGSLTITSTIPQLILNGTIGNPVGLVGRKNNLNRWQVVVGDGATETGISNAGANFVIERYDDTGTFLSNALSINRSTGATAVIGDFSAPGKITTADEVITTSGHATLTLNTTTAANGIFIVGQENGVRRWVINPGVSGATKNFGIERYNDAGTTQGYSFSIDRATNTANISGALSVNGAVTFSSTSNHVGTMSCGTSPLSGFNATIKAGWAAATTAMLLRAGTDSSGNAVAFQNAADATVGAITTTAAATVYATSSDERLKEDLKSFDASAIIDETNVYDFAWKSTGERAFGVIAQQANTVYPTAVSYNKEADWWGVDYSRYVPVILQELKALRARVAELEAQATP